MKSTAKDYNVDSSDVVTFLPISRLKTFLLSIFARSYIIVIHRVLEYFKKDQDGMVIDPTPTKKWLRAKADQIGVHVTEQSKEGNNSYLPPQKFQTCSKPGKIARARCDWFWFCFSLVEKPARDF